MHRQPLLRMLADYEVSFPDEQSVVEQIRSLVEGHEDCFERTCRPGHITGSAWILSSDHCQTLLTHHRKLNRWLQLGGHADGENLVENVALREAQEESGMEHFDFLITDDNLLPLDIDVHLIPERRSEDGQLVEDAHEHHDIRFLLIAAPDQQINISHESHDLRWFDHRDVASVTTERSVLRLVEKTAILLGK